MTLSRRSVLSYAAGSAGLIAAPSITRAQAAPINLVFSHHLPIAHIGHKAAESFASRVKAASNGQVTVDIKPASQLFNLRTSAEALQLGTLDMCWS
ncbi:MAG: Bacterial extracellular solute-binding protein family 7, partial [Pseudomonadota bacterium]